MAVSTLMGWFMEKNVCSESMCGPALIFWILGRWLARSMGPVIRRSRVAGEIVILIEIFFVLRSFRSGVAGRWNQPGSVRDPYCWTLLLKRNVGAQQILDAGAHFRSLVRETAGAVGMDKACARTRRNARGGGAAVAVKDGLATNETLVAQV